MGKKIPLFIFAFCFLIGFTTSPPGILSSYLLSVENQSPLYLPVGGGIKSILSLFKRTLFYHSYRLSVYLVTPLVRWVKTDVLLYKLIFSSFYGIFGITLFSLLKKLIKDEKVAFLSALLTLFLPQFVFYSWPIFELSNIMGAWFTFLTCFFFLADKRNFLFYIFVTFVAFFSAFGSEQSRLFTVPFLFLLFLFYKEKRKKNLFLIGVNFFFTLLSLFFHIKLASIPQHPLQGLKSGLYSFLYYTHFIFCYYLFSYGYIGVMLFISSFTRFLNEKAKKIIFPIFFLTGFLLIFSMPVYPYTEVFLNFFFVTDGIPYQFFLIAMACALSMLYLIAKCEEKWEKFASSAILVSSGVLLFIMGIYPRIRDDPSARHLLVSFPFFSAILINTIFKSLKGSKVKRLFVISLFLFMVVRNLLPVYYLSSMWRGILHLGYDLHAFFSYSLKTYKGKICVFYSNPQFYIFFADDIISPLWKREAKVFRYKRDRDLPAEISKECEGRKVFIIFSRFKPVDISLSLPAGERFFEIAKAFMIPEYDDQQDMMEFARMHTSHELPIESYLKRYYYRVFRTEGRYYVPPFFINELFYRLISNLPFSIPYEFYFEVYEK